MKRNFEKWEAKFSQSKKSDDPTFMVLFLACSFFICIPVSVYLLVIGLNDIYDISPNIVPCEITSVSFYNEQTFVNFTYSEKVNGKSFGFYNSSLHGSVHKRLCSPSDEKDEKKDCEYYQNTNITNSYLTCKIDPDFPNIVYNFKYRLHSSISFAFIVFFSFFQLVLTGLIVASNWEKIQVSRQKRQRMVGP